MRGDFLFTRGDFVSDSYPDYNISSFPWETEINVLLSTEIPGTEVVAGGLPQCRGWVAGGLPHGRGRGGVFVRMNPTLQAHNV
jgi:hypothetical protein